MKDLIKYLRPHFPRMGIGLTIKITGTIIELALPYILSYILKSVVYREDIKLIIFWGGIMVACAAAAFLCNTVANRMAALTARNFSETVRHELFEATLRLSAAQRDRFTIPSLESRITTDTYNVHQFVGMMQRLGVRAPILLIGGMIITLIMDSYLALAMLAILPFIFVTVYFISRKGVPLYIKVQQAVDRMIRVVREDAGGIRVIKALSKTEYEHKRYDTVNSGLSKAERKANITMGAVNPIMTLLMNMGIVAVVAISASRVANHTSDAETVIAFMQYFTLISMAMMSVTRIFIMYTKCEASAKRISEVINTECDLKVESEDKFPSRRDSDLIVFDNVSFSYNGTQNDLSDISFSVKKGGSLGIIGPTGSGKSTVIKLLLRFYDIQSGCIRIDGRDIRTIPKEELYKLFGTAMQNDFLYSDTVEENIKFGRELSEEQIRSAAKIAQADGFISELEKGYEHLLSQKGTNISGGQKQRLLISRALAAQPEILILDDSSSALDYKTDAALRKALKENCEKMTVITVAQRVSSVKDCDLILVLEEGRIIGMGDHDSLISSCPEYKEISDSQMGGAFLE